MSDFRRNSTNLSQILGLARSETPDSEVGHFLAPDSESKRFRDSLELATKSPERRLSEFIRPRKLKLDKTLNKFKMHKSLPVSPVSEERQFADFVERKQYESQQRQSFSYFFDFDSKSTDEGFKQICSDIEKFSQDFTTKYDEIEKNLTPLNTEEKPHKTEEEETNFSSDSLEDDYDFYAYKKPRKTVPPRRCVSNNEIYKYQEEPCQENIPKSESFYLNPGSQESILSDDNPDFTDFYSGQAKSYCNSLESVLSNESDCKSAPLEVLFQDTRKHMNVPHSKSLPKNISSQLDCELSSSLPKNFVEHTVKVRPGVRTCQTQTDFETPQEIVAKKARGSEEFQKKLLKFESVTKTSSKKPLAFFVETSSKKPSSKENIPIKSTGTSEMFIPSLAQKNKQYKSKFCNVLNNKPDQNFDIYEERSNHNNSFTLSTLNFDRKRSNRTVVQETSSLDRHLFAKSLLNNGGEKVTHKPPKAVRRHSSKNRKGKTTYEYIRKEDFYRGCPKSQALNNKQELVLTGESTIELKFKETNVDIEVEAGCSSGKNSNFKPQEGTHSSDYFPQRDPQNTILTELYDSLDKKSPPSKMDLDSLEINLNNQCDVEHNKNLFDSLEANLWFKEGCLNKNAAFMVENVLKKQTQQEKRLSPQDKIAVALQNIKVLNDIQKKIHKINVLVDIYRKNVTRSKVRALSSMYESMTSSQSYYNDLTKLQTTPIKYRRRNLSLPSFVERRLNFEDKNVTQSDEGEKPAPPARITPRYVKNNSMMRSKSSVVLNQHSDSENDPKLKKMSRLMRPTISSHNKISQKPLQARKKQSYSTSNLNQIGVDNLSTSDEEETPKKPQVPPRMSRQTSNFDSSQSLKRYINNQDPKKVSNQLCEDVSKQLMATADNVVKIYQKLKENEETSEAQPEALDNIKMSLIRTYKVVHDCIFNEFKQNNGNIDVNQTDAIKKLNDLVSKGASGSGSIIELMQQYTDILLDMMQQKIHSSNI